MFFYDSRKAEDKQPFGAVPTGQPVRFCVVSDCEAVTLVYHRDYEPQSYLPFVALMNRAYLILTDSGGVQEEAPSLGKPVLVMRDTTERPEAVDAGTVKLIGTHREIIEEEVAMLLIDSVSYARMSGAVNPYGDGEAVARIIDVLSR